MQFEFNGMLMRTVGNQHTVAVEADTLGDALAELASQFPHMKRILLDNSGQLRQAHRILLNGEFVTRPGNGLPLSAQDRVEFFTAIAGG